MRRTNRTRSLAASALTITLAAAALVACSNDSDGGGGPEPSGETITVDGVEFPVPEKTTIKIGIPGITTGGLAEYYAIDAGIYAEFGLDVELVHFQSGAQTTQALLANQIDAGDSDISVLSTLTRPDPAAYAFIIRDNLTDALFVRGDIENADDLRGEAIAISQFGSQSYAGALLALESLGLTESDVTLTQVGGGSDRLAALLAGSVAGSINDPNEGRAAEEQGFREMVALTDLESAGIVRTSLAFNQSFIEDNPNTVLALVAAIMKARHAMFDDPERSAKFYAEAADISVEEATEAVEVELNTPWLPVDGRCTTETVSFMKDVLLSVDPTMESVNAEDVCDNSFIDQLDELGWTDRYAL